MAWIPWIPKKHGASKIVGRHGILGFFDLFAITDSFRLLQSLEC
jgi:hypothetical protein